MYSVLLVDDKEIFLRKIKRLPYFEQNEKFNLIETAKNGLEALDILRTQNVDIVLSDIKMPLMDGISLLKEINKRKYSSCTILLSEYTDFQYAKEGILNGAFDYVVKPVTNENIKDTFDRAYTFLESIEKREHPLHSLMNELKKNIMYQKKDIDDTLKYIQHYIETDENDTVKNRSSYGYVLQKLADCLIQENPEIEKFVEVRKIVEMGYMQYDKENIYHTFCNIIHFLLRESNDCFVICENPTVQMISEYIISNIEREISLDQISEMYYINRKYISTLFKEQTGIKYSDYVKRLKIKRAKILLLKSNMKIYEIAQRLGFKDEEYFSKVFKKNVGIQPSKYRWEDYRRGINEYDGI